MYNEANAMPGKFQSQSLSSRIFESILIEAGDLLFLFSNPQAVFYTMGDVEAARSMLARKEEKLRRVNKKEMQQVFRRLEKQKLIRIQKKGNQLFYFLTEDGIQEGLKQTIQKKKKTLQNGLRCYISFDIPEKASAVRWALRKLLKTANFKMIHFSLWASKFDVGKEIALLIKIMKAEEWVHVFEAKALTGTRKK